MKKSYKQILVVSLIVSLAFIMILFSYVRYKLKMDVLRKEKVVLMGMLNAEENEHRKLTAAYQVLADEDNICTYAGSRLGLVYSSAAVAFEKIDIDKIEDINRQLKQEYEY